ncbi:glycerol-3-phosphate acyltransferase PlsY [Salirhabdus euzebyi]|uniref:Glycerol-3-phosphate acyltransferase n=1 Tax=Salirhabdus euzebyi TaxID=394506 RepID=A0A841Q912_9BACI|nr:glycerol-3-phosphate acyltransferase [Salirhabdus euzebyi]MBB6454804.1 glycerol-3-phosphate acyltransferase PlsY [Salirhabdus euzebyi]
MIYPLLAALIGYAFGCIQPSYFIGKYIKKSDIKTIGTGNAGASNVTIHFGWKFGIIVALIDILKPVIAVIIISLLFHQNIAFDALIFLYFLTGAFVIIGHNFPFYMNFNGGKGTASMIGLFFVLDWKWALIGLLLFVLLTILTNYIVIGAMALYAFFDIFAWMEGYGYQVILVATFLTLLAIVKHNENFVRIARGEEAGLRDAFKKDRDIVS